MIKRFDDFIDYVWDSSFRMTFFLLGIFTILVLISVFVVSFFPSKKVYYWAKNPDGGALDCPVKGEGNWYFCESSQLEKILK